MNDRHFKEPLSKLEEIFIKEKEYIVNATSYVFIYIKYIFFTNQVRSTYTFTLPIFEGEAMYVRLRLIPSFVLTVWG